MSTAPPDRSDVGEPRFRDALRSLPGRVWIISLGILVNRVGNFLPVFIVLYLTERGYSAGAAGLVLGVSGLGNLRHRIPRAAAQGDGRPELDRAVLP